MLSNLKRKVLFIFVLFICFQQIKAQTTWTGATSTDWNTTTNWDTGIVPIASTNVIIANVGNTPVITTAVTINQITVNTSATLTLNSGASLILNGASSNSGTINGNAGTITISGTFTNNTGAILTLNSGASLVLGGASSNNGTINSSAGAGTITINNTFTNAGTLTSNATAGAITINNTFTNSSGATFTNNAPLVLNSSTIVNSGTSTISNTFTPTNATITNIGTLAMTNAVNIDANLVLANNSGSTLNIANNLAVNNTANFSNNGTINVTGTFINNVPLNNNGTLVVTGLITMNNNINNSGTITANLGMTLITGNTYTNSGITIIASGQNLTLPPSVTIDNSNTFTNNGTTLLTDASGDNTFAGAGNTNLGALNTATRTSGTLTVSGTNVSTNSALIIVAGVTLNISAGGQFSATGGDVTNNGTITNNGRLNMSGILVNNSTFTSNIIAGSTIGFTGTGNSQILGTNAGAVQIFNLISAKTPNDALNTVTLTTNQTVNGSVTILANGRINLNANLIIFGDFTNNGTFTTDNSTRIVSFEGNVTQNILGSSNTTFPTLNLSSKPASTILNIGNTTNTTSATITSVFTIPSTITVNIANTGTLTCNAGLINNGTLATTNTTGTATLTTNSGAFTNNGTLNLNAIGGNTTAINVNGGFLFSNTSTGIINHIQGISNFNLTGSYLQDGAFNNLVTTNRTFTFIFSNVAASNTNVTIDGVGTSSNGGTNITTGLLFSNIQVSTGTKVLTIMKPISMLGNLIIDANTFLTLNAGSNNQITYSNTTTANFTDNGTFTPNISTVAFTGSAEVNITGNSQVVLPILAPIVSTNFYIVTMNTVPPTGTNQPVGITLSTTKIITIGNKVDLLMGRITSTTSANNPLSNAQTRTIMLSGATFTGGTSNSSYINGLLQRNATALQTNSSLIFPIGKTNRIGRMALKDSDFNGDFWGEYFNTNPLNSDIAPGNPTMKSVSDREYWRIQQIGTNAKPKVILYWNDSSADDISTNAPQQSGLNGSLSNSTDLSKLTVARSSVDFSVNPPNELGWEPLSDLVVNSTSEALPAITTGAKNTRGTLEMNVTLANRPELSTDPYQFYTIGSFEDNPDWQTVSWVGSSTGTMRERTSWMNKNNWLPDRVPNIRSNVIILGDCPSYPDLDPTNVNDVANPNVVLPSTPVAAFNAGTGNPVPTPSNAMPPAIRSLTLARFILPTNLAIAGTLPTLNIRNGATLVVREIKRGGVASPTNIVDTPTNQGTGTGISQGQTNNSGTITIDAGGFFLCDNTFFNNEQGQVANNGTMRLSTRTAISGSVGLSNGSTNALTPKASIINNGTITVGTYNIPNIITPTTGTGAMNDRHITNRFNSGITNNSSSTIIANNIVNGTQASDNTTCFITNNGTITNIGTITNGQNSPSQGRGVITNNNNWTTGIGPSTSGDITNNSTAQIVNTGSWNVAGNFTNSSSSTTAVTTSSGTMNITGNLSSSAGTFTNNTNVNVTGTTAISGGTFTNQSAGNYNATGNITYSGASNITNNGLIRFQADLTHNSSNSMLGNGTLQPYGNATQNMNSSLEPISAWTTTQSLDLSLKPANTILNWNASSTFVNNVVIPVDVTLNTANNLAFPTIAGSLTNNGIFNLGTHTTAGRSFFLRGDLINNNIITANTGSVVTFSGNTNTITSGTTTTNNLVNLVINKTGSATGQLNNTLNLSGNLTNTSGLQLNTGSINLQGNFINNSTVTAQTDSNMNFVGTTTTSISGSTAPALHHITLNKTTGNLNLSVAANYNGLLTMTRGLLNTSTTNLLTANIGASTTQGNDNAYVVGPMRKILSTTDAGATFTFPSGKGTKWARIAVRNLTGITNNDFFTAEYFANGLGNYAFATSPTPVLVRVSTREYWQLDRGNTGGGGGATQAQVEIFWEDNIYSGINEIINDDLKVARWNGTGWENRGGGVLPGPTTITGTVLKGSIYTNALQNNFSPWAFGAISNIGNPLPADLLSFDAKLIQNQKVQLSWKTWNEMNTKAFEIQRSNNAIDFQTVTINDATGGVSQIKNYQIIDNQPFNPITYYRLKTIDNDNSFKYSQLLSINLGELDNIQLKNIYPNPFQESVNVEFSIAKNQNYEISIIDIVGNIVFTENKNAELLTYQKLRLNLSHLPQGVYILKIKNGNNIVAERIVKIN